MPVYELLGGPTRNRVRVYSHAGTPEKMKADMALGFTAFKTGPAKHRPSRYIETPAEVQYAVEKFAELRRTVGNYVDIAIDFHGAISPATAKLLIKGLEPYQPYLRRGALPGAEPRGDGGDRARHLPADRHRRARVHQVGLPRRAARSAPRRCFSPTCATRGASPSAA